MEIFGFFIPLWALFIIGLLAVIVLWKLIKFAIKLLIIVVVFFVILIGLDVVGVFDWISEIIALFL